MFRNEKIILFGLTALMGTFSILPVHAGYYKTIYVEEAPQLAPVVVQEIIEVPQQTVIIRENNYRTKGLSSYNDSAFLVTAGLTAFASGIALGSLVAHRPAHFYKPRKHFYPYRSHHR